MHDHVIIINAMLLASGIPPSILALFAFLPVATMAGTVTASAKPTVEFIGVVK